MSERVDLREFVGAFVAEADELMVASTGLLLEIERAHASGASRPRAVRDLLRAIHTIKGLAGMIGVEPIVEIAHGLETLLRLADRAGGALRPARADACLQAVGAIRERVRAVAEDRPPAPAPPALLELLAEADVPPPVTGAASLVWDARLGASEREQLAAAVAAHQHVWTVTFAPSEANAAIGVTIASVRERLAALGEIVKVQPRATPNAPSSVAFDLLVISEAPPAAIAAAAATTEAQLIPHGVPAAVPAPFELEDAPAAIGRSLVRVELARLDELQDQLSLLIVSRFKLEREIAAHAALGTDIRGLREVADLQGRQLRDLRRAILRVRMVRLAEVLEPLPLLVRGLARSAQRDVQLALDPDEAELDKAVADRLLPALIHLVRNAVDHAIETGDERAALGKPRHGTVRVACRTLGANRLELVVADDGRGIDRAAIAARAGKPIADDRALLAVLTAPGFTTRTVATRTSGRGLGMDIVQRIAVDTLGGELELATTVDVGTQFTLRVPLTIAVVDVFSFECGAHAFVVPVSSIEEIFELGADDAVQPPAAPGERAPVRMVQRRGHAVSVLSLGAVLALDGSGGARKAMVTRCRGERVAFVVDRMLGRHEVVVRPIDDPLVRVPGVAGATDLGTGRPTLVLDLGALHLGAS